MKFSAKDLHDIISLATLHLEELNEDIHESLKRLSHDAKLLLACKADYDLNPSLSGYFWEDMAKLEKIFSCHSVDLEKEFPKNDI